MSENKIRPPIRVFSAETPFLHTAHILVDTLHKIPRRLTSKIGNAGEERFTKFLIGRARLALKELDHEAITGLGKEMKQIEIYLNEAERYLNERESIQSG